MATNQNKSMEQFQMEYDAGLQAFKTLRKQHTRTAFCNREFVLVPRITEALLQPHPKGAEYEHDLERLFVSCYYSLRKETPRSYNVSKESLEACKAIFYTLLDIDWPHLVHRFIKYGTKDDELPLSLARIEKVVPAKDLPDGREASFYQEFYKKQYAWCPVQFKMDMQGNYGDRIIPGYRRQQLQPKRDRTKYGTAVGKHARVWVIELPQELGDVTLDQLPTAKVAARKLQQDSATSDDDPCYQLVLKTFDCDKEAEFESEEKIHSALRDREGFVRYVGSYRSSNMKPGIPDEHRATFTLVLERARHDLYEAFRHEVPPVSLVEMHDFYTALFDVARTLKDCHWSLTFDKTSHCLIHGDIKPENILRVADRFKLADLGEGRMDISTPSSDLIAGLGGTTTYAAPEKYARLTGKSKGKGLNGRAVDVWSLGCVFSDAATFLVLGKQGVQQYIRLRLRANGSSDAFHDGTQVLGVVQKWHNYLRANVRKHDRFTTRILDIVDQHLLVPADNRWDLKQLCDHFGKFLDVPHPTRLDDYISPEIAVLLLEMGEHELEESYQRKVSDPVTKSELYAEKLLPTSQRPQGRQQAASSGRTRRQSQASSMTMRLSSQPASRSTTFSNNTAIRQPSLNISTVASEHRQVMNQSSDAPGNDHEKSAILKPITVWHVQHELEDTLADESLSQLWPLRGKRTGRSVRQNEQFQRNSVIQYDPLEHFLQGRDIVSFEVPNPLV
jgi:serine/threonine protein kinase